MPAALPVLQLDAATYKRSQACVHCGLCLAACPTYLQTAHEADSPRGRIQLIRGLADGIVEATPSVQRHLDLCLDCRACETACPSNVIYHELIEAYRINMEGRLPRSVKSRIYRWLCFQVLVHPARLKLALLPLRLIGSRRIPPGAMWPRPMEAEINSGGKKMTVALFGGCVGSVMFDAVNRKAAELLAVCGARVISPRAMGCCGAIHYHGGARAPAAEMARRNIDALLANGVDRIVTTAGGCGAMLKEYDHLLRDDAKYAQRAKEFAAKVKDVTEVLLELGPPELKHPVDVTATYHDSCHLAHGQKVRSAPRELLGRIPGLKLAAMAESDGCCGAAGTYFLNEPEMAGKLAERKLRNIAATGASICVAGNAGCTMHLRAQANRRRQAIEFAHPVELLHRAVFGPE